MRVLVTGSAGFIGYHVARRLLQRGDAVTGFDNVNAYYDRSLKRARLAHLEAEARDLGADLRLVEGDLVDAGTVETLFQGPGFDRVIHLAAQAGVRYSLENPRAYIDSNVVGFGNIIDACRRAGTPHLTYASSSSVYGANRKMPLSEHDIADHPIQLYAATKRANELMAHSYSHLYALPTTGLRFFTVYGPWGRPDMAPYIFADKIASGTPIPLFNHGAHSRDFTYVDDIVEGVVRASDAIAAPNAAWDAMAPDPASSPAPFRIFNIGNGQPVELRHFVGLLEEALGRKAHIELLPMQMGDIADTHADISEITKAFGYQPSTSVEAGVKAFAAWFLAYRSRQN